MGCLGRVSPSICLAAPTTVLTIHGQLPLGDSEIAPGAQTPTPTHTPLGLSSRPASATISQKPATPPLPPLQHRVPHATQSFEPA
eukprot:366140-Chlamydomonas_euryale.AAC.6